MLRVILLISLAVSATEAWAARVVDPALRFRTLRTDHFVIYFHQGEDRLASRLGAVAEETWLALRQPLAALPPPLTHVVLVDQTELANGSATPLPYNTVIVTAAWPAGVDFIGDTDDWLRLVFTHEFTHIVHLDRSEGWARIARNILGRSAIAFPNVYLPTWQIEGLATYEESLITGTGRLHAGDFRAVVGEEVRQRRMQSLDRVNGGLTDWPSGNAAYAYGLAFHQYLADRFGTASLGRLADATSRRVPYVQSQAFRQVFGEPLGELWRDFEVTERNASRDAAVADPGLVRLTRRGFVVSGPRFDPYDRAGEKTPSIVYSSRNPEGFPALNRIYASGGEPTRIVTRYFGDTTAVSADTFYFDQQEVRRNTGLYSDLYALSRASGRVTQLTNEARLIDPDLSPDGSTLVCAQDKPGRRDLVLVQLGTAIVATALISEPETQFNAPRWSPDGRTIAVERHRPGGLSQVVLVDVETKRVRALEWGGRARVVTPAWRPDGRAIIAAVAPDEEPFNLYEFEADDAGRMRQLTHTTGGATWPDVSPDGRTIAFVGYTVDGSDVFTIPYPDASENSWRPALVGPEVRLKADSAAVAPTGAPAPDAASYSPWPTLRPTSWWPIVESDPDQVRAGAIVTGSDVLGYHSYSAQATWLVAVSSSGLPVPGSARPDWSVSYAYERWQLVPWISAEATTSFFVSPGLTAPSNGTLRERQLEVGVQFPIVQTRQSQQLSASMIRAVDDYTLPDRTLSRNRDAFRAAWGLRTAHTYGYSVSPEQGVSVGGTVEAVRKALGSSADATSVTADLRAYVPMTLPHHVLAARLALGTSSGDATVARTFRLGGPGPNSSVVDFGRDAFSLLRGFPFHQSSGSHVALVNLDYRFPITRPQRGAGTWPVFLHTLHASVFGDAGETWTESFRFDSIKTSVGGELSTDVVAGYFFPFTVAAGAAWGHDNAASRSDRATFYVRIGRAF